ncbi:MAG: DsbA family protein [Pyrinomonadaceae bacterium]|nr:DsbA family protein [Pyrinomonadaceae bacterium]
MQKQTNTKSNSNLPLAIIGLVLVAALVGGWWLYSSSKAQPPTKSNTNSAANKQAADSQTALDLYRNAPAGAQPANMLGVPTAAVTIEEFADYQCPTCATVHTKMKEINSLYSGRIKFIYRSFPLTQIHKNAYDAAVAAEAAGMQGSDKFWSMQNQLFTNQQAWANSSEARKIFEEYANKIGLDAAKFQTDMAGLPAKTRVDADMQRGKSLAISGTPTIYINGSKLAFEQMDVNSMRQIIDAELQKSNNQTPSSQPVSQSSLGNSAANQTVNSANKK